MAQFVFTVNDAQLNRVLNRFTEALGYSPLLQNGDPNPETKAQFLRRTLINYIKSVVQARERQIALEAAELPPTDVDIT